MKKKGKGRQCKNCGEDISIALWVDGVKCGDGVFVIEGLVNYYKSIGEYDLSPIYNRAAEMCSTDPSSIYLFTQEIYAFEPDDVMNFHLPHDSVTSIEEFGPVCTYCGLPLPRK